MASTLRMEWCTVEWSLPSNSSPMRGRESWQTSRMIYMETWRAMVMLEVRFLLLISSAEMP